MFCLDCLKNYFLIAAKEAKWMSLGKCPTPNCQAQMKTAEVLTFLPETLQARYLDFLKRTDALQRGHLLFCPRMHCQDVAFVDSRKTRMGVCSSCRYTFCRFCQEPYHGESACEIDWKNITDRLENCSEKEREQLYNRIPKSVLEEMETQKWLMDSTRRCPGCGSHIEKTGGCNHVTCPCGVHMCFLCGERLNENDPYTHFSQRNRCKGRLFEGAVIDELEDFFMEDEDAAWG